MHCNCSKAIFLHRTVTLSFEVLLLELRKGQFFRHRNLGFAHPAIFQDEILNVDVRRQLNKPLFDAHEKVFSLPCNRVCLIAADLSNSDSTAFPPEQELTIK